MPGRAADRPQFFRLTVEDDGPGVLADELPHVFQRFDRGARAPHGLAISIELPARS